MLVRPLLRKLAPPAIALVLWLAPTLAVLAGPPWIAIELPANPFDPETREAFLVVRTYHHGDPASVDVSGSAEGMRGGRRESVRLAFSRTSNPGVYALTRQWPGEGDWALVISVREGKENRATALVDLGADGQVTSVRVPTGRQGSHTVPRDATAEEIAALLTPSVASR